MEKSIAEVLDGYSIAWIKSQRIGTPETIQTFESYEEGLKELVNRYPTTNWDFIVSTFIKVNETIWKYESEIRKGMLDVNLEETGRRAILVREFNQLRVGMGNIISVLVGQENYLNIKKDHVSE